MFFVYFQQNKKKGRRFFFSDRHSYFFLMWAFCALLSYNKQFFAASGVQLAQQNCGLFHFCRSAFTASLKAKVNSTLSKTTVLRIILNIDGEPITSKTHTHPSHSETSRLLTSSLSLGVPVPRSTQCIRGE
jgi:hypothetical protein